MYRREMTGRYRGAYNRIRGAQTGEQSLWAGIESYENPRARSLAYAIRKPFSDRLRRQNAETPSARMPSLAGDVLPSGAPRVLKLNSMKDAPGLTVDEATRAHANRSLIGQKAGVLADPNDERRKPEGAFYSEDEDARASRDLGIAFRHMSQQRREMKANEGRLDASAGRAGVVASPKVENNGSVTVAVHKAGPKARVTTSASGQLFRDIVQNHGRQIAKGD